MTYLLWILFALCWLLQSILCYGMTYAYFTREFHDVTHITRKENLEVAIIFAFFSFIFPPCTISVFLLSERAKHGLKFR